MPAVGGWSLPLSFIFAWPLKLPSFLCFSKAESMWRKNKVPHRSWPSPATSRLLPYPLLFPLASLIFQHVFDVANGTTTATVLELGEWPELVTFCSSVPEPLETMLCTAQPCQNPHPRGAAQSLRAQSKNLRVLIILNHFNTQLPKTVAALAGKEGSLFRLFSGADNWLNACIFIVLLLTQHELVSDKTDPEPAWLQDGL